MNQERAYLSQIPGLVAIKSTPEAPTDYLNGLILRQPMTEVFVTNLNKKYYHWLCHSEFSWFLAEGLPIAYGLFLHNQLDFAVSFDGSQAFLFFLSEENLSISNGRGLNTLDGSPPYLASKIYEKEYRSISPYWTPPPLKNFCKDKIKFNFKKSIVK